MSIITKKKKKDFIKVEINSHFEALSKVLNRGWEQTNRNLGSLSKNGN